MMVVCVGDNITIWDYYYWRIKLVSDVSMARGLNLFSLVSRFLRLFINIYRMAPMVSRVVHTLRDMVSSYIQEFICCIFLLLHCRQILFFEVAESVIFSF